MSHWALVDENNIVVNVAVGDNDLEDEGQAFFESLGGTWLKTSINTLDGVHYSQDLDDEGNRIPSADQSKALRGNFAGVGMVYNSGKDEFGYQESVVEPIIVGGPEATVPDDYEL